MGSWRQRLAVFEGQAVGDALGAGTEGRTGAEIVRAHGRITHFVPDRPFGFLPGEFTDDTQMVLSALHAYSMQPPTTAALLRQAAGEFVGWLESRPPDVGGVTYRGLVLHRSTGRLDAGLQVWADGGHRSAANGGLMRVSATFIAGATGEALLRESLLLAALTHADPRSLCAALVVAACIEALSAGVPDAWEQALDTEERYPVAETVAAAFGARWADAIGERLGAARRGVRDAVAAGLCGEPGRQGGFVLDTLQAAAHASRARDFIGATGAVAMRGNDSDTAAAVSGALLAAAGVLPPEPLVRGTYCRHRWPAWDAPAPPVDFSRYVPA